MIRDGRNRPAGPMVDVFGAGHDVRPVEASPGGHTLHLKEVRAPTLKPS
jgi:hypothetical protein